MTNWQLIITLAAPVLAIFGANLLSLQLNNKRIDDLNMYLDARFDAANARFDAVEQRIGALEQRIKRIERQLETLFARFLQKSGD
jgi:hypothetical protein